jgi:hypothetical protein
MKLAFRLPFVTRKTHEKTADYLADQLRQSHTRNLKLERELHETRGQTQHYHHAIKAD